MPLKDSLRSSQYVFRKGINIGAADANDDNKFIYESFVDTGEISALRDIDEPQAIVVGRTGAGKTALLKYFYSYNDRVIAIEPQNLALTYIANSGVLDFFIEVGVNMELFYNLLWRHIFIVEILRKHYDISNEEDNKRFLGRLGELFKRNDTKRKAVEYLTKWGNAFWEETDIRTKEIVKRTEKDLSASLKTSLGKLIPGNPDLVNLDSHLAKRLTDEQKSEVKELGQKVVNRVQMSELARLMSILNDDILTDAQKRYYITIDKLDEGWISERLRYPFLLALLNTVMSFNREVYNAKIIVALREDLIERVFRYANPSGHQEEKISSCTLTLRWTKEDLVALVNARLNQLAREKYTSKAVSLHGILPREPFGPNYLLERTMLRPRDVILFVNSCLSVSEGKVSITRNNLVRAEEEYSSKRLDGLRDEWKVEYPNLISLCLCCKRFPPSFKLSDVLPKFETNVYNFLMHNGYEVNGYDYIYNMLESKFNGADKEGMFLESIRILHHVGFIGIKPEAYLGTFWSYQGQRIKNISADSVFFIHPVFWRVLGIHKR